MDAPIERARWWSWRRQRLDRTCRGVEDCLRSVIGVAGANPHGPLSLLARVPRLLKGAAVEGVIGTKRAVQVPAMRRSVLLVPRENAALAFRATPRAEAARGALRRAGIGETRFARLREQVLAAAGSPLDAAAIRKQLSNPPKDLAPVLQAMCDEGVLLRIKAPSIRSNDFSFCATEAWLGEPLREVPADEALVWLAGDYLSSYGPATPEDFAAWTGMPRKQAAEALASLEPADVGGGWLMHRRDERAFAGMRGVANRVNLLPRGDCYTTGYGPDGRRRFAPPEVQDLIYDGSGNATPVVLVEGSVAGTWEYRLSGDRLRIKLQMFERPGPRLRAALDAEAELVAIFLETGTLSIVSEQLPRPRARRAASRRPAKRSSAKPASKGRRALPKRTRRS